MKTLIDWGGLAGSQRNLLKPKLLPGTVGALKPTPTYRAASSGIKRIERGL